LAEYVWQISGIMTTEEEEITSFQPHQADQAMGASVPIIAFSLYCELEQFLLQARLPAPEKSFSAKESSRMAEFASK